MIPGLDRAISTMKKNECALVAISPDYGYGNTDVKVDSSVPPSTLLYEVEMLDFVRVTSVTWYRACVNIVYMRLDVSLVLQFRWHIHVSASIVF